MSLGPRIKISNNRVDPAPPKEVFVDQLKENDNFRKKGGFGGREIADRSFLRAEVSFPFKFSVILETDFEEVRSYYLTTETKNRIKGKDDIPLEGEYGKMVGTILRRLDRIEGKLNRLLDERPEDEMNLSGPLMEIAYARIISGAGIRMGSVRLLSPGWFLNIEINTREPYPLKVVVLGRLVRNLPSIEGSLNESACEFVGIHEMDRKKISDFVYRRQKELSKMRQVD